MATQVQEEQSQRFDPLQGSAGSDERKYLMADRHPDCAACSSPAQPEHTPCCSSTMHSGKALCCLHYCKYHYVEVRKCSPAIHELATS